eukprot:335363-Prymnesium_polylepis.1
MDWSLCSHIISQLEEADLLAINEDLGVPVEDDDDDLRNVHWESSVPPLAQSPLMMTGKRRAMRTPGRAPSFAVLAPLCRTPPRPACGSARGSVAGAAHPGLARLARPAPGAPPSPLLTAASPLVPAQQPRHGRRR